MDLAASVQAVTEEVMMRMAKHVHQQTGMKNLVLAGGVALNCVGNGCILREGPFDNIWIQPAAGDAGGALGTALFIWHQLLEKPRIANPHDSQKGSFLGPEYAPDELTVVLDKHLAVYEVCESDEELCDRVATLIAEENVIGWFQGRMEFGPRALGARSIIGDARSTKMQSVMNLKIKFRESFRPFAPIVLKSRVHEYFEMRPNEDSPYMLLVAPVRQDLRCQTVEGYDQAFGIEKLNYRRSTIPAVTHVDYSARVQTVDEERNPLLFKLMTRFDELTGCPVLINTSFNVRSEPIVCTPEDAYRCFLMTDMDVLVMGRVILLKDRQANEVSDEAREQHLKQFQLD
jgi:carbamoyltransferase